MHIGLCWTPTDCRLHAHEKHLAFECPALQDLRDRYEYLFQAPQVDAMILFMWQDDIIGVAWFFDACLEKSVHNSWPSRGGPGV